MCPQLKHPTRDTSCTHINFMSEDVRSLKKPDGSASQESDLHDISGGVVLEERMKGD